MNCLPTENAISLSFAAALPSCSHPLGLSLLPHSCILPDAEGGARCLLGAFLSCFHQPWALTRFRLDPRAEQVMRLSSMVSFLNGQGNQQDLSQGDKARKGREQVRCPDPLFLMLLSFSCEDDATWRAHPVTILALISASRIHQIYIRAGTAVFPLDFLDLTRKFSAPPPQPRFETSSHDHGIGLTRSKPCSSRP